ncbi:MAG: MBL fold metallo-hydrolase, partial [Desulfoprunum sp.]|nr:MBL fold metallo-hydrolase [Desulfoprunum sp.]
MHSTPHACRHIPVHRPRRDTAGISYRSLPLHGLLLGLMLLVNATASRAAELSDSVFLTFFDVGQGDALLIHQPDRCAVLIDTGPPGSGRNIGAFLAKKGISRLDRLIISHPHEDHFAGTLSLPPDLTIAQVNDNGVTNNREKSFQAYQNWRARHLYHPLKKGDVWRCGQ